MEITNNNINNIFDTIQVHVSFKSRLQAEFILADHLAKAFNLLEMPLTKSSNLHEEL